MSKDSAAAILRNKGYDAEVKSGVVTIYYSGELKLFANKVHVLLDEIGYNMSIGFIPGERGLNV